MNVEFLHSPVYTLTEAPACNQPFKLHNALTFQMLHHVITFDEKWQTILLGKFGLSPKNNNNILNIGHQAKRLQKNKPIKKKNHLDFFFLIFFF